MKKSTTLFVTSVAFKIICLMLMVYDLNNNNYGEKAVGRFVFYLLLTEICLSINFIILSKNNNFLQGLIPFYLCSFLFWGFLSWIFGCTYDQYFTYNNCITIIYFGITTSKIILASSDKKNKNQNNINENYNDEYDISSYFINSPSVYDIIPNISFSSLFLCLSSAFYLLDWNEKWQVWPIPSSVGIFFGSFLDDIIIFFFSRKTVLPSLVNN